MMGGRDCDLEKMLVENIHMEGASCVSVSNAYSPQFQMDQLNKYLVDKTI